VCQSTGLWQLSAPCAGRFTQFVQPCVGDLNLVLEAVLVVPAGFADRDFRDFLAAGRLGFIFDDVGQA